MRKSNPAHCLIFLCLMMFAGRVLASDTVYTFGVVPQQTAIKTAELWLPVLQRISEQTGITLELRTTPSIPEFESALANGQYDFAYMNPYHYVHFHDVTGYQAMAHASNKQIKGIIVARKDSGIKTLRDLQGQELAFPSPAAFAASILTRAALNQRDINYTPRYVNSHDSVYISVYHGNMPAGGGVIRTFMNMDDKYRDELKVVWSTQGYTPHAIAHLSSVPMDVVEQLQAALIEMVEDAEGRALLDELNVPAWQAAQDADWNDVRSLNLHLLDR